MISRFIILVFLMLGFPFTSNASGKPTNTLPKKKIQATQSMTAMPPQRALAQDSIGNAPLKVEDFLEKERAAFENSNARQVLARAAKEADLQLRINQSQDPWSITNNTTTSKTDQSSSTQMYGNKTTLAYSLKEGFGFQTYFDKQDSSNHAASPSTSWNTYGASASYEFMKTGKGYQESISIADLQAKITKIGVENSYLSQLSNTIDQSINLYVQHCKLRDTQMMESMMMQTVKIAEVQLASKAIDIQDYLRINDLYLSFQRSIQSALIGIVSSEQTFAAISDESAVIAKSLTGKNLECEKINQESQNLIAPKRDNIDELINQHPQMISLDLQRDQAKRNLSSYQISRLPAIQGSAGLDKYNPDSPYTSYDNMSVGLNVIYNFGSDDYKYNRLLYSKRVGDIDFTAKATYAQLMGQITQLYETMANQANFAKIAKLSLDNSEKLLKVTQTRQAVGVINSDGIYSAYSNFSASIQALRDLWASYKTSELHLVEIKKSIERTKKLK